VNKYFRRLKTTTGVVSTVVAILIGVTFVRLGLWQLDRAQEKQDMQMRTESAALQAPLTAINPDTWIDDIYRPVKLSGSFDWQRQFLLDNRTVAGQAGFDIITPFFFSDDQYVLVNRGWIGHNGDRRGDLPNNVAGQSSDLIGLLTKPSRGFTLGDATVPESGAQPSWPVTLQYIDYGTIAAKLDKIPVIEGIVVADANQPFSLRYHWKPVAGGAETHLGYAFQWFAMLAALICLYLYWMVFKKHD